MGWRPNRGAPDTTISLGRAAQSTLCAVSIHWTISSYLAKEVAQYTALGFLAAAPVVLIPNLFDRVDEFLIVGIT